MNSNVTLRSNIYVNKTARSDDVEFLQQISDYRVLKKKKNIVFGAGYSEAPWMTPLQHEMLRQGQPNCSYEKGTMSWGVPIGGGHMRCRCEQYDCRYFHECEQYWNFNAIHRDGQKEQVVDSKEEIYPLPLFEELMPEESPVVQPNDNLAEESRKEIATAITAVEIESTYVPVETERLDKLRTQPETPVIPQPEVHIVSQTQVDETLDETHKLVTQETIINAGITERIWVNAGPGTGKTYIVIQRLVELLKHDDGCTVLVLCFSRNAVQVIHERLGDALGRKVDSLIKEGQLVVRTFDSFASYMLDDELNTAWNYDRRIEEFIKLLKNNRGSINKVFSYFIVDEIQDIVGVRARMLLAMLDELSCGVLLLGDRCQAIFDWTIRDTDGMTFDVFTANLADKGFKRYELEENRRQSLELAQMSRQLRATMLTSDESAQEEAIIAFKKWVCDKWGSYIFERFSKIVSGYDELILCKTNGEAAHVSQQLFENAQVEHIMKQSSGHRTLAAWIAKVLHGNNGRYIEKAYFLANAEDYEIGDAEEKWMALKALDAHPRAAVMHIPEVLCALSQRDGIPEVCLNHRAHCTIVSTVHRAKGSEAAHVYWLDSPLVYDKHQGQEGALRDSLKAAYVAATRAKSDIYVINMDPKLYLRIVNGKRWIKTGLSRNGKPHCKSIALLPEDTDSCSFVEIGRADEIQTILARLKTGYPLTLYPDDSKSRFDIYFDGFPIGAMSSEFTTALFAGFAATNHNKNWLSEIRDVYISAVETVIAPAHADVDEKYRTAGCWLGIELGGFPNIGWS